MQLNGDNFDRVGKWWVDRYGMTPAEARARLAAVRVAIVCGTDVAASSSLQASLLTLVNLVPRVFKRAPVVALRASVGEAKLRVPWPASSLGDAVRQVCPSYTLVESVPDGCRAVVLGADTSENDGLRVTFDGWSVCVAPVADGRILAQRDLCPLAGMAGAAMAVSELFAETAGLTVEACHREVGISLWRPDLDFDDPVGIGPEVAYLPGEAWFLGLGHVGQGALWALSLLPYARPGAMRLLVQDFDRVAEANIATQALTSSDMVGRRKVDIVAEFLRRRSFDPAVVARRFDGGTKRYPDEPSLAFCCFDGDGPRFLLDQSGFDYVVECGVGGEASDFDSLHLHTLPLGDTTAEELWPRPEFVANNRLRNLIDTNPFYRQVRDNHGCGELDLAGRSVAVPHVGAIAGSIMVAEALRMLHGGARARYMGLTLSSGLTPSVRFVENGYRGAQRPRLAFPHLEAKAS